MEESPRGKDHRHPRHQRSMRTRVDAGHASRDVATWRYERLVAAGFGLPTAARLAADARYDVHQLTDLVARGCPPELAARILEPLRAGAA